MRIHPEVALLVCLCLWIPVAQSQYGVTAPEDQDTSGDDEEFSGSGSGDIVFSKLNYNSVPTEASPNTTIEIWVSEAGLGSPELPVTQLASTIPPETDPETKNLTDQVPVVHTTQTSAVTTSLVNGNDEDDETTASLDEVQAETTELSTPELPVVPVYVENTTPALYEEETTVSDLKEGGETTLPVDVTEIFDAVGVGTTPVPLSMTSAVEPADPEASGDGQTTTPQATTDGSFSEDIIIPDVHGKEESVKPDEDFEFEKENEINPRSRAELPGSELTVGSSSDNESLLERKEVLAGVIAGGVVGLAFAVMLVSLMVYRMKKKDEGSYALDEHKHPSGYQKAQRQEEFLA